MQLKRNSLINYVLSSGLLLLTILLALPSKIAAQDLQSNSRTVIIDNGGAFTNNQLMFDYDHITPGFRNTAPVHIYNYADTKVQLTMTSFVTDPEHPNVLFPYVSISLHDDASPSADSDFVLSPVGALDLEITNNTLCIPANTATEVFSRFIFPRATGNDAQATSLRVEYELNLVLGDCDDDAMDLEGNDIADQTAPTPPPSPTPTPKPGNSSSDFGGDRADGSSTIYYNDWSEHISVLPPAGEGSGPFYFLISILIICLTIIIIFSLILFFKKKSFFTATKPKIKPKKSSLVVISSNIFFGLCLLILAAAICLVTISKRTGQAISVAGFQSFIIASGSMEPTLRINGLVLIKHDDFDKVRVGDIVAFRATGLGQRIALHRVIKIVEANNTTQLIVQGDNNSQPDGAPVTRDNYLGKEVWHTNALAQYLKIKNKRGGWILTIAMPLILLALFGFATSCLIHSAINLPEKILIFAGVIFVICLALLISSSISTQRQINHTNKNLAEITHNFSTCQTDQTWQVGGQTVLGRIEIPELNLDYPIIKYQTATSLDLAITHFSGAEINQPGNSVLAGHRIYGSATPFNLFFTQIDQLQPGAEIFLTDPNCNRIKYTVTSYQTVSPDDTSVLEQPSDNQKHLTLISCSPDLKDRYIVHAVAVE